MNKIVVGFLLCVFLFLYACSGKRSKQHHSAEGETSVELLYAKQFSIAHAKEYTVVTVFNPWKQEEIFSRYYLIKEDSVVVPTDGCKVKIPIQTLMVNSATHLGFLEMLGELDKVTGVCSVGYIYNPKIRQGVEKGSILDLGDSFNLDIEHLLMLRPELVMTSAYNADDENSRKMKQTGLPIAYNIEWQEKTVLGRAEWIKFVAAFFDKQSLADSLFLDVENHYNSIKEMVADGAKRKPSILSGQDFRGSWSMPGGRSFNAILIRDAGASYYYENDQTTGSISSSIEEALIHFADADVWIGTQVNSLKELGSIDPKYKLFKAFKEGNVYNTFNRVNKSGGNDYWESGVARPDLLLSDLIKIIHPALLPDYELTYLKKLTD